jgi:hypothetical protein
MVRTMPWIAPPPQPQRRTTLVLMALIALLTRWVIRLERAEARQSRRVREFEVQMVEGRPVGAVYEDGRLIGVLPDVARL